MNYLPPLNSRLNCSLLFGLAFLVLLAGNLRGAEEKDPRRFQALFADGKVVWDEEIEDRYDRKPGGKIRGKEIFDEKTPAVIVRDHHLKVERPAARIEFANGDVLPAQVLKFAGNNVLLVRPVGLVDGAQPDGNDLRIRYDMIRRVVRGGDNTPSRPGLLVLADGSRVQTTSSGGSDGGLRVLTSDGLKTFDWADITSFEPIVKDPLTAATADLYWHLLPDSDYLETICIADGSRLTFPRQIYSTQFDEDKHYVHSRRYVGIQPIWAFDAIRFNRDQVALQHIRRVDELPLALLPAQSVEKHSLHAWPWRLNKNVLGEELTTTTEGLPASHGLGTHAHSEIKFELPNGAAEFRCTAGLDPSVGQGGCVIAKIFRDSTDGELLWESKMLTGADEPQQVGPLKIKDAKSLVLVVETAHDGRPDGADPLDIRDHFNWIMPVVRVEAESLPFVPQEVGNLIPELAGWQLPPEMQPLLLLQPGWDFREGRFRLGLATKPIEAEDEKTQEFTLTRELQVDYDNAWLKIAISRSRLPFGIHIVELTVDDQPVIATDDNTLTTNSAVLRTPDTFNQRVFHLTPWLGKKVQLTMQVHVRYKREQTSPGLIFKPVQPEPLIRDGVRSQPIQPSVALTDLKPTAVEFMDSKSEKFDLSQLAAGKRITGEPLELCGMTFDRGFGVPAGTLLTYELDGSYTHFVAVLGRCDDDEDVEDPEDPDDEPRVGPYEILLDGEVYWKSEDADQPREFSRHDQARQINVPIPAGHQTITLKVGGKRKAGFAAWAAAGFVQGEATEK